VSGGHEERDEVLKVFGQRIRRDIPLAEVLLQSAETLRRSMDLDGSEIWTGREGRLERTASVPERPAQALSLDAETTHVAARAGVVGPAWLRVWLPALIDQRPDAHQRAVPLGFAGELLGLIVVERTGDRDFSAQEEEVLAELGRQMGLALHNTQLDLALQDTLDEVRRQAGEIQASRRRLVAAADGERRRIERDLHDGAQQHLVALSVNLRLTRDMVADAPEAAVEMLDQLHLMVKDTVEELRTAATASSTWPTAWAPSAVPSAGTAPLGRGPGCRAPCRSPPSARQTPDEGAGRLQGLAGTGSEGVDDDDPPEILAVLEILGQEPVAASRPGGGNDERIPVRDREAILDGPCLGHQLGGDRDRTPGHEIPDVRPRVGG